MLVEYDAVVYASAYLLECQSSQCLQGHSQGHLQSVQLL